MTKYSTCKGMKIKEDVNGEVPRTSWEDEREERVV